MGPASHIKRFLPRSLLGRSLLIIVSPLILLQVISTFIFYDRHWDTVTRRLVGSFAGDIAAVIRLLHENPEPDGQAAVLELAHANLDMRLIVKPGEILPNTGSPRTAAASSTRASPIPSANGCGGPS